MPSVIRTSKRASQALPRPSSEPPAPSSRPSTSPVPKARSCEAFSTRRSATPCAPRRGPFRINSAFKEVTLDLALNGLVAVVTGGTSGIGLAAAEVLLAEGASVAICSRTETRVDAEAERLRARYDARVFGMAADVRDADAIASFRRSVIDCFGHVD